MLSKIIQQKVFIGDEVTFILKTGREIDGQLTEIGQNHITVENESGPATILMGLIGGWEIKSKVNECLDDNNAEIQKPIEVEEIKTGNEKLIKNDIALKSDIVLDEKTISDLEGAGRYENKVHIEAIKKVTEIIAKYQVHLEVSEIKLVPPSFNISDDEIKKYNKDERSIWNRIKNKYEYALKVNELSSDFGRIQDIINELKSLVNIRKELSYLKKHLAYLYFLSGNYKDAINCYKEAILVKSATQTWVNLAAIALKDNNGELACYSLEKFFMENSVSEYLTAWYVYLALVIKYNNYQAISRLVEKLNDENDLKIHVETMIYFFSIIKDETQTTAVMQKLIKTNYSKSTILDTYELFDNKLSDSYKNFTIDYLFEERGRKKKIENKEIHKPKGYISVYKKDRNYGFLRDLNGKQYFFHRSAIIDETIYDKLLNISYGEEIPVVFESTDSPKGPLAVQISHFRRIDELFEISNNYANDGDYNKAIASIKRVLTINSNYPHAQELFEKWREYARFSGVPKGSNFFARAKRVQIIEKNLEKAVELFNEAIKNNDNAESAVKDLAMLLVQVDRSDEAIKVLNKNQIKVMDKKSLNNLFIQIYQKANKHDEAIKLLNKNLRTASGRDKKAQILFQIAGSYLRLEKYKKAEEIFKNVLEIRPNTLSIQRNIALCILKQKRYDEAEEILNRILNISPDSKSVELLDAIKREKSTGISSEIDQIIIETSLSDFSAEVSTFSKYFLNQCDFQGVPPDRVKSEKFWQSDIKRLEDLATELGTKNPRDRSKYYLSAAKIVSIIDDNNPNLFYRYLCRCFASFGDAFIYENRHIDSAKELYCEALSVYDGDRSRRKDEQDAVNALVRFIFSTLGQNQIPTSHKIPSIDETIETVFNRHPNQDKLFDAFGYLITHSRYAANRILNRFFQKSTLQAISINYLKEKGIRIKNAPKNLDEFVCSWNELRRKNFDDIHMISNEFRFFNDFKLTTAWIENSIEKIKTIINLMFLDLDRQRMRSLQSILENALDFCKQVTFEEQERLCILIELRCQDIYKEINENPTRLSIESINPAVKIIQQRVKERLSDLYETSKPQPTIRLAVESYPNNKEIEIQIVVANKMGCSPAESIELIIIEQDEQLFKLIQPHIKMEESLRGGDQRILKIPMILTDEALESQTFSLSIYAQYRTRLEEVENTYVVSFSIRLYSEEDFDEIYNPYADYAEGGIVGDPDMFYGREELINNISFYLKESRLQSKCVIVFGQKRAGKSSILYHLKKALKKEKNIIILDIGNIGSLLDVYSNVNLLYQILWNIVRKFQDAIEDCIDEGFSELKIDFPDYQYFTTHSSPLILFKDIFDRYKRLASKKSDWKDVRIVVLMDEFSYIYSFIVSGKLPDIFMKNWKALLQENYFNAVLAGQDVMPKFKQHFPNEFGTTQDERVSYLKYEDAVRLIDEPIRIGSKKGETRYREKAIDRIVELTAGSPFYIQIICNRLVEYMNRKHARLVTEADVEQVKKDIIKGVNALSLDKFDNLISSGDTSEDAITDEDAIKVLKTIATNSLTGPCNHNCIIVETSLPTEKILNDLINREVIEREREQYYNIRVGLFKEWIIANL